MTAHVDLALLHPDDLEEVRGRYAGLLRKAGDVLGEFADAPDAAPLERTIGEIVAKLAAVDAEMEARVVAAAEAMLGEL